MKNKDKENKTCRTCGRTIVDPKNKTGLCPDCREKAQIAAVGIGAGVGALIPVAKLAKKHGPKLVKSVLSLIKAIK